MPSLYSITPLPLFPNAPRLMITFDFTINKQAIGPIRSSCYTASSRGLRGRTVGSRRTSSNDTAHTGQHDHRTKRHHPCDHRPRVMSSNSAKQHTIFLIFFTKISQRTCSLYTHITTYTRGCIVHNAPVMIPLNLRSILRSRAMGGYSSIFVLCPNGPKPHCVLSYNGPRSARSNQYPTSSHTTRSGQCPHSIGLYTE